MRTLGLIISIIVGGFLLILVFGAAVGNSNSSSTTSPTSAQESNTSDNEQSSDDNSDKPGSAVEHMLENYGITYSVDKNIVVVNVDEDTILGEIPDMQQAGILNPDITQTSINIAPVSYASVAALYMTPLLIGAVYSNSDVDQLHFKTFLTLTDDYGNPVKKQISEFHFSRALYNKINWDSFQAPKLIHVAHVNFTDWYTQKISEEGVFSSPQ